MVECLRMLENNRRVRERIDKLKNKFTKIDACYAKKMGEDEKDLSDEEYMKKWCRNKGWRSKGWTNLH